MLVIACKRLVFDILFFIVCKRLIFNILFFIGCISSMPFVPFGTKESVRIGRAVRNLCTRYVVKISFLFLHQRHCDCHGTCVYVTRLVCNLTCLLRHLLLGLALEHSAHVTISYDTQSDPIGSRATRDHRLLPDWPGTLPRHHCVNEVMRRLTRHGAVDMVGRRL